MDSTTLGYAIAIIAMRTSGDVEEVREYGRAFAVKYVNLIRALSAAQQEVLRNAQPEEVATIERVFDAISNHEVAFNRESFSGLTDGLDTDGPV